MSKKNGYYVDDVDDVDDADEPTEKGVGIRSGKLFQKTAPMPFRKLIHSLVISQSKKAQIQRENAVGKFSEQKFHMLCDELISRKILWWLVSCKHAPYNEDRFHQTDFKLRSKHANGIEFYLRVQVKSSWPVTKSSKKPLPSDIVLVVMTNNVSLESLADILDKGYKNALKYVQYAV